MIQTSHLVLRPLTEQDGPILAQATDETWEDLAQWMRWATDRPQFTDPVHAAIYAQKCHEAFQQKTDFVFSGYDVETGDFVLTARLAPIRNDPDTIEFCGYWCRKKYQGKEYMTEAVQALVQYAFDTLHAHTLIIKHAAGNHKARAVMDKVGFVEKEILRNAQRMPDGRMVDEHVLMLTRTDNVT